MPHRELKNMLGGSLSNDTLNFEFHDQTASKKSINLEYLNHPLRQHLISNKENLNTQNLNMPNMNTMSIRDDITVFKARPTFETN